MLFTAFGGAGGALRTTSGFFPAEGLVIPAGHCERTSLLAWETQTLASSAKAPPDASAQAARAAAAHARRRTME